MTEIPRYFYKKEDRLKSRKAIDLLFKQGKSFSHFPFRIIWLTENNNALLQAGIGVSSKHFKRAVDRNRIKRLMREAYRLQKSTLQNHLQQTGQALSVFILYIGTDLPVYSATYEKFTVILNRLIKLTHEKTAADS